MGASVAHNQFFNNKLIIIIIIIIKASGSTFNGQHHGEGVNIERKREGTKEG